MLSRLNSRPGLASVGPRSLPAPGLNKRGLNVQRQNVRTQSWQQELAELFGDDKGDCGNWNHASEWYGSQGGGWGRDPGKIVWKGSSYAGNGLVTVTAHRFRPRSTYDQVRAFSGDFTYALEHGQLEWRVLRFNEGTRQSVNLVAAPESRRAVNLPYALGFDYIRSMASVLVALRELQNNSISRLNRPLRLLFLGCGGATLALFARRFLKPNDAGIEVICVDLDSVVLQGAVEAMGVPTDLPGFKLVQADAASYVSDMATQGFRCDYVIFDVFDGQNRVPPMLLNPQGQFMRDLSTVLDPSHGSLLINLHGDPDKKATTPFFLDPLAGLGDPGYDPRTPRGEDIVRIVSTFAEKLLIAPVSGCDTEFNESEEDPRPDDCPPAPFFERGECFTIGVKRQRNVVVSIARGINLPSVPGDGADALRKALDSPNGDAKCPWLFLPKSVAYGYRRLMRKDDMDWSW